MGASTDNYAHQHARHRGRLNNPQATGFSVRGFCSLEHNGVPVGPANTLPALAIVQK